MLWASQRTPHRLPTVAAVTRGDGRQDVEPRGPARGEDGGDHIGETLFITEKRASLHVSHILAKLGVAGRGEAAAVAHRLRVDQQGAWLLLQTLPGSEA